MSHEALKTRLLAACPAPEDSRRQNAWAIAALTGIQRATSRHLLNGEFLPGAVDEIARGVQAHYRAVLDAYEGLPNGPHYLPLFRDDLHYLMCLISQSAQYGWGKNGWKQREFIDRSGSSWRAPPPPKSERPPRDLYLASRPGARFRWYMAKSVPLFRKHGLSHPNADDFDSETPPSLESLPEGHLVGELDVGAHGEAVGEACDASHEVF